jgi:hypothetical protein
VPEVNPDHLARLDGRLRKLLEDELAAGNEAVSTLEWPYGRVQILVMLRDPFRARPADLPEGVGFEESRDHWLSSGVLMDYRCRVATPPNVEAEVECWQVLRSVRPA